MANFPFFTLFFNQFLTVGNMSVWSPKRIRAAEFIQDVDLMVLKESPDWVADQLASNLSYITI